MRNYRVVNGIAVDLHQHWVDISRNRTWPKCQWTDFDIMDMPGYLRYIILIILGRDFHGIPFHQKLLDHRADPYTAFFVRCFTGSNFDDPLPKHGEIKMDGKLGV